MIFLSFETLLFKPKINKNEEISKIKLHINEEIGILFRKATR